jgi:hypothetical protein
MNVDLFVCLFRESRIGVAIKTMLVNLFEVLTEGLGLIIDK